MTRLDRRTAKWQRLAEATGAPFDLGRNRRDALFQSLDAAAARAKASRLDQATDAPATYADGCHNCLLWTRMREGSAVGKCRGPRNDGRLTSYAFVCADHLPPGQ